LYISGGGGGGGGYVPPEETVPVEEAQKPVGNILFVPLLRLYDFSLQLWMLLVLFALYGWWSEQHGIMWASLLMLGFLYVFGSHLLAIVGGF
jgi:hypothetical protein